MDSSQMKSSKQTFSPTSIAGRLTANYKVVFIVALVLLILAWPKGSSSSLTSSSSSCPTTGARYGIMMDAGSTGSRTHVFEFAAREDGTMELVREVFEELKPGLSSFKDDPEGAAKSLVPLMETAVREVPIHLTKCTPIALKATAGLRLIGKEKSDAILTAVNDLFRRYPFAMGDNAAEVMDGRDEGPYAWLTVNFLLGTLNKKQSQKTAAILDMGGASTQMVFEPDESRTLHNAPPEFRYEPTIKGLRFETYQNSYLGLGLKEAGKTLLRKSQGNDFPCFPKGHTETLDGQTVTNTQASNFEECLLLVNKHVVRKSDACSVQPCAFNGVFQPNLLTSFTGPVYAFSYFYDRMEPFLEESGVSSVGKFREVGKKICESSEDPFASKNKGTMCMDFAYLYGLLRNGYGLPDDHTLHIRKKIKGVETAWALGAMIVSMQF